MKTLSAVRLRAALEGRLGTEGFLFYSWGRKEKKTAQTSRRRGRNEEGRGRKQHKRVKTSGSAVIKLNIFDASAALKRFAMCADIIYIG